MTIFKTCYVHFLRKSRTSYGQIYVHYFGTENDVTSVAILHITVDGFHYPKSKQVSDHAVKFDNFDTMWGTLSKKEPYFDAARNNGFVCSESEVTCIISN